MTATEPKSTILINVLSVDPAKQQALVELLTENTENVVIKTLKGWISTSLIASEDGTRVVIYSQWESPRDVDAMRSDPRMQAYFPRILALATFDSIVGTAVLAHRR